MSDFVSQLKEKESQDTIQEDGFFELRLHSKFTQPVFLKIENVTAKMYVQPDFVYGITIPEIDEAFKYQNDAELPVNIGIIGADSTELNALIFDFQAIYTELFSSEEGRYLSRKVMFKRADSLKRICERRYEHINDTYFKSYYEYSIASINAMVSRGENFLINNFILNKPILYEHFEYMQFFNASFTGYLSAIASMRKGQSLYNIINVQANFDLLDNYLKEDKFLKKDSLRELVMLKNLWDLYYSNDYSSEAIKKIISDLNQKTRNAQHQKISATMLSYFNKMQAGSPAPNFRAKNRTGASAELYQFKGRWIYLNFFSTKNLESLREMAKIGAIRKKMADKVVFISVCLDDSLASYSEFLRANPKFDWQIWFNNDKSVFKTAKESYFVHGTEAYFLINTFGYLAQSPALSPSGGIEYKLNSIFKPVKKNTKTGIR